MKLIYSVSIVGVWAAFAIEAQAQMSTFPLPPPLPSASPSAPASQSTSPAASQSSFDSAGTPSKSTGTSSESPSPSATSAATMTSMSALDDKTLLEAGDTVSFRVIEDRDQPVSRIVTDTGEVDFPYIGRVKVEGKTCHAVAGEVKKLLEVDYYKQATVILGLDLIIGNDKTKPKDLAWVMGEVREVGPLELLKQQPMTVSQMIMRAGGFGDFADQRKVKVIHRASDSSGTAEDIKNSKDFDVIDVKSVFDGTSATDPLVKPGDYIIVPKKMVNFGG